MGVKGSLAKGAAWLTGARMLINLIGFASTLLLARLLTPEDFGVVALATTMLSVLTAVTELSLASALIHHRDPQEDHFHTAWTFNVVRSLIVALGFAAATPLLARIYHDPRLTGVMLALAGSVVLSGLTNPKMVLFFRALNFTREFALSVSQKLVGFLVSVGLALLYHSYWALVAGTIASQVVTLILSYRFIPYRPRLRWRHGRDLLSFSIWLTLDQIVTTLNWRLDYLVLGSLAPPRTLGLYSVGDNLAALPTREATLPIMRLLFPGLSRLTDDDARMRAGYTSAQTMMTAVALPVGVGFALCARPVVELTMGAKWLPVVFVIQGLAAISALQTLGSAVQPLAMARGATRRLFHRNLVALVLRLPLVTAGILIGGMTGLIYARMVAGIVLIAINLRLVHALIGTPIAEQLRTSARSLASAAAMAAGVLLLQRGMAGASPLMLLIASAAAGAALYLGVHGGLWRLAGMPPGPEREAAALLGKLIARRRLSQANGVA